MAKIKKK